MPQNTSPIWGLTPNNGFGQVTAADAALGTGNSANDVLVFTAGSNGSFLEKVQFTLMSTSGSVSGAACTGAVYLNNGSTQGTAANDIQIRQITLPATTVTQTATTAVPTYEIPLNIKLAAGYKIYAGVTAITANSQWSVIAWGVDY